MLHEGVRLGLYVFFQLLPAKAGSCGFTFSEERLDKQEGAGQGEGEEEEESVELEDSLRSLLTLGCSLLSSVALQRRETKPLTKGQADRPIIRSLLHSAKEVNGDHR